MASNKEWLESLPDAQLAEEIKYGRLRAETPVNHNHQESAKREYDEALFEQWKRERK